MFNGIAANFSLRSGINFFAVSLKNSNVRVLLNIKTETPIVSIRSFKDI